MEAVRCLSCGATRWALTKSSFARLEHQPCELCGGQVVRERRRPSASVHRPLVERRDARRLTDPPTPLART